MALIFVREQRDARFDEVDTAMRVRMAKPRDATHVFLLRLAHANLAEDEELFSLDQKADYLVFSFQLAVANLCVHNYLTQRESLLFRRRT